MRLLKSLSGVLAASLMLAPLSVQASGAVEDWSETSQEVDSDTIGTSYTGSATVTFDQTASFVVKVPKTISLNSDGAGKYTVGVKGQIPIKSVVQVVPDETITMSAAKGVSNDITADVTPDKTVWKPSEVAEDTFTESTENVIQMRETDYSSFSGTLNFGISLKKSKVSSIEYELGEGVTIDGENPDSYVKEEGKVTLAPAVKEGFDFGGWYSDPDFENKIETLDQIDGDTTLYPKFGHLIQYNLDGGKLSGNYVDMVVDGKNSELPIPAKDGYEFVGWYTTPEFSEGTEVTTTEGLGEDTTLYAKFVPVSFGITYDLNGGNEDSNSTNPTTWCIEDGEILLAEPTKNFGEFVGWYDNKTCNGEPITSVNNLTEDIKLYAKWESLIGAASELADWTIDRDDDTKTITLNRYVGTGLDVVIKPAYYYNGEVYSTYIKDMSEYNGQECASLFSESYGSKGIGKSITSVTFRDGVQALGNINYLFEYCLKLQSVDLSGLVTPNLTQLQGLFSNCRSLTSYNLGDIDMSKITDMEDLFEGCESLTEIDLSDFDTSNVTDMCQMFNGCKGLTELDLSSFNTSKVINMSEMFKYCNKLIDLDLRHFDVSKITRIEDYEGMFFSCSSLEHVYVNALTWNLSNSSLFNSYSGVSSVTPM